MHENEGVILNSVLRSVITVVGIFAIAFLKHIYISNVISQNNITFVFAYIGFDLQTLSFVNGVIEVGIVL